MKTVAASGEEHTRMHTSQPQAIKWLSMEKEEKQDKDAEAEAEEEKERQEEEAEGDEVNKGSA